MRAKTRKRVTLVLDISKAAPDLLCQQQIEVLFTSIMLWRITRFCALAFAPAKNGLAKFRVGRQFHDQLFSSLAAGGF